MFKRIIALLLCATLTLACVSSALGETCYVTLKTLLSDPDSAENNIYLGSNPIVGSQSDG